MPNWCENDLTIYGKNDDLKLFKERSAGVNGILDINNFIPYPIQFRNQDRIRDSILNDLMDEAGIPEAEKSNPHERAKFWSLIPNDGFNSGGYEWCIENWGTKWNFCEPRLIEENDDQLFYAFDTAWSPPLPVIKKMGELFPALEFDLRYFEGGMGFHGIFVIKDGEIIIDRDAQYFGRRGG